MTPGTKLGPYEILEPLGAGGMGEVYRGRDPRLNRDVAIKVLPAALAGDATRMARLQREAQVLASLSHPHLAALYEQSDSSMVVRQIVWNADQRYLGECVPQRARLSFVTDGHRHRELHPFIKHELHRPGGFQRR